MKKLFNLKRLLSKRNNGGFTLVEVIISCALLGILVVGVVSFATPVMNMIYDNQKSARATLLAETLDSYIAGSLKGAKKVEVFTDTSLQRARTVGMVGTQGWLNINAFMMNNHDKYEVRCIGICWLTDYSFLTSGKKKLMLTNIKVDNNYSPGYNNTLRLSTETKVFDDSLYNNLYPVINIEEFSAQDSSGNETGTNASGYKISAKIYSDKTCYSVISEAARKKSHLAFEGVTYAQFINMNEPASPVTSILGDTQGAISSQRAGGQFAENGNYYFYPDTFIYYVVAK